MDRLFLDANILFSASYSVESILRRLWNLSDATLLTSAYAVDEVRRNISADQNARLEMLLPSVAILDSDVSLKSLPIPLPEKDQPILAAAIQANATHLLTGDVMHFGPYLDQKFAGVLIQRPGVYLRTKFPDLYDSK